MSIFKSGSQYFVYNAFGGHSLTTTVTDAYNAADGETPDIVPLWLSYVQSCYPSMDWEVAAAPVGGKPPIKDLPPHH